MSESLEIYDTTLRDGTQGLGVNLSLGDKLALAQLLDDFGIDYVEGGWPGSNPKDQTFFREVRALRLSHAKISAFGSTRHARGRADEDGNLRELVESRADVTCIFGKSWDLHVTAALRIALDENLELIEDSVAFLARETRRPVFYDAEHFFDGFRENPDYALRSIEAAARGGAVRVVLCDTNGGSLPAQIATGVRAARERLSGVRLGIHVHDDGGLAVANTLAAVEAGCTQVQGTINGVGERCGNVDLTAVLANLELKLGRPCLPPGRLARLTDVSRAVWERMNLVGRVNQAFVGAAAFAHKGGVHVSAMQRDARTYEHVSPEAVGNLRQILVSELSGRSNVAAKLSHRYPELADPAVTAAILKEVQDRENEGYSYESADDSFDLLVRRHLRTWHPAFELEYYRVHGIGTAGARADLVEATVKLRVQGEMRLCVAEGNGPVDALAHAIMQALVPVFPVLGELQLSDYKVRVVNSADGTAAKVLVRVEHRLGARRIGTVGVSENVIEASWRALVEAVEAVVLPAVAPG
ncbi:MAG: citramalate synthase [Deltaproteobacteria bacterium]|nr:citramalate synthase [Deltaproteobacteria bacterium]